MARTKIEWAHKVWNPVTGCTKISTGCLNCYAERYAKRFWGKRKFSDVQLHPDKLAEPLRWKNPLRVFVNSMSDLFHESIPFEYIVQVYNIMASASRHVFQVLTKRPERAIKFYEYLRTLKDKDKGVWPHPNVWLGVSVENQNTANARIPLLLRIPAALRFISAEPLLGPIDLKVFQTGPLVDYSPPWLGEEAIKWVICGGESGPAARLMHPD